MLSSKKAFFLGISTALVAAAVSLLLVMVASVGSRPAEAQPRTGGPDNPLRYVMEDSPQNRNGKVKVQAKCPSGYQVISGGFDVHYLSTPWFILESRPSRVGPGSEGEASAAWVVVAQTSRNNPRPFTAYAVCAPESLVPPASIKYPTSTTRVSQNSQGDLTPDCPTSHKAIGGGFRLDDILRYLVRSQPNPGNGFRSWIVRAGSGRNVGGDFSAYSVCVREDLVSNLRFFDRPETGTGFIQQGTPPCPQGTYLLAGGGGAPNGDAGGIDWSHIRPGGGSQADPPKDWAVGAKGGPFSFSRNTVHAHAMCGTLVGPQAGGGGGNDGATNDNDGKKQQKDKKEGAKNKKGKKGKHGGIQAGKGYGAKVGGVKAKGGHARVGPIGASL